MLKKNLPASFVLFAVTVIAVFTVFSCRKINLKGQEFIVANWWEDYDVATFKPQTEGQERQLEWRKKIQNDNGFKMMTKNVAGWDQMLQTVSTSIMSGKPVAHAIYLQPDWAMTLYKQGLLAPIPASDFLKKDTVIAGKQVAYNQDVAKLFTFGGKQYAIGIGYGGSQHSAGVYFNKRLFKEAGLDPDEPYNLQKAGTWTWDKFIEISKKLTRDTRNTGRINTWAMPADLSTEILDLIVFSNGGEYIGKDAQGKFTNATNTPAFIESLQFARRLMEEGVMMPRPDGSNWDWYWPTFHDGVVAMLLEPEWRRGQMQDMTDDWGYVLFPKGPRMSDYRFPNDEIVIVIPSTYKPDEVEKILHALNLWETPVTDNWKDDMYPVFRDRRAVDETMAMIRSPKYGAFRNHMMIPDLQRGDIAWNMWWFDGEPAQLVEKVSPDWNAKIADANKVN